MALPSRSRTKLPGFGDPVQTLSDWNRNEISGRFPHAIADYFASSGLTLRERRMLDFMNQISDKPNWHVKVFDDTIVEKWKAEGVRHDDSCDDWYLSERMFECCMLELREKAQIFKETGMISVLDAEAAVVKSDSAVSDDMRVALSKSARVLEDVPDSQKDWHPGSNEQVLDLLHPSLFPVVFGLTRVSPTGTVPLPSCTTYTGHGETTSDFAATSYDRTVSWGNVQAIEKAWGSYQWLPSNLSFRPDGTTKIDSYVNNLHPHKHKELYAVLEQFVDAAVPLWNECLSSFHRRIRISLEGTSDEDYELPEGIAFPRQEYCQCAEKCDDENADDQEFSWNHECEDEYRDFMEEHRILIHPEPKFTSQVDLKKGANFKSVDLRKDFPNGLQVIFKLANIVLEPEDTYGGGEWHVEGSLNEHICATALYYYDSENIEDSSLGFRQSFDVEEMVMRPAQSEFSSLEAYYGVENESESIMELPAVITRQGRLLAFPNVLQHQVQPFGLLDESKKGYRKVLAMFLVDPHIPILSTANVPPQRKDWWADEVRKIGRFAELPTELFEMIINSVEGFPLSWEDALDVRERLMAERGRSNHDLNHQMETDTFSFVSIERRDCDQGLRSNSDFDFGEGQCLDLVTCLLP